MLPEENSENSQNDYHQDGQYANVLQFGFQGSVGWQRFRAHSGWPVPARSLLNWHGWPFDDRRWSR